MTDLNRLIEDHIGLVHDGTWGQRSGFHVPVERVLDPGLSQVEVIPQELGRVLLNLLNNAFYAVGEQHKREPNGYVPAIRISTHGRDGHVEIRIKDNGTGIPEGGRERIFSLFQRMHGRQYKGTGMGLAIVRKLVERMGANVGVESEVGKGSRFWIELKALTA